ncbi:MAG: MT-A70 family methyltransferase [Alphaproteobacteria bacterium]
MSFEFTGLQNGHYAAIAIDPPWKFKVRSVKEKNRLPPYQTMAIAEIKALPVQALAAKDCFLFLWTTGPHLVESLELMKGWGFAYSSLAFVWVKTNPNAGHLFYDRKSFHVGMGYTTRKNAEYCLLGRRGRPVRISKKVHELIISPRREHSRKPDEFYDRVVQFCDGPRADIFSREDRAGFDSFGDQSGKFNKGKAA